MQVVRPWEQPQAAPLTSMPTGNGPSSDARMQEEENAGTWRRKNVYIYIYLNCSMIGFPSPPLVVVVLPSSGLGDRSLSPHITP